MLLIKPAVRVKTRASYQPNNNKPYSEFIIWKNITNKNKQIIDLEQQKDVIMKNTDYFSKKAKELLKDFNGSNPSSNDRILKHLKSVDGFGLMKAQHIIAKEFGFNSWDELNKITEMLYNAVATKKDKLLEHVYKYRLIAGSYVHTWPHDMVKVKIADKSLQYDKEKNVVYFTLNLIYDNSSGKHINRWDYHTDWIFHLDTKTIQFRMIEMNEGDDYEK
ncbi:MAG: hypothetical protein LBR41_01085 [Rickettsiales bacterium]|nr:hypothetical protein [Rickettsiales bacterium]